MQSFFGATSLAVVDPVNAITGEFYVNTADIQLHGPIAIGDPTHLWVA